MKNKINEIINSKYIKNFIYLFSGTSLASLITLLNSGLLIRALGLEKSGILFLGLSYVEFFNTLLNFHSYEAIIKFLPNYMGMNRKKEENCIKQAFILDILTAMISFLAARFFLNYIALYLEWNEEIIRYIKIQSWIILFSITGGFVGVLRIYEKFKSISFIALGTAIFNLVLYIIGMFFKFDLIYYIYLNLISSIVTLIITIYFTIKFYKLDKENIFCVCFDKKFIKFNLYTNLSSTLDLPIFQLTPFIINRFLGISDIAIYKILEKIGELIKRITTIMGQTIIPEISKKIAIGNYEEACKLGKKLGVIILSFGIFGVCFIYITDKFWLKYFIPDYQDYLFTIYFYLLFIVITQVFVAQHSIFIYSGYAKENVILLFFVNIIYLLILVYLAKKFGLDGIIFSRLIQASLVFVIKGVILYKR